jgi:uncharacterized membrane protein
MQDSIITFFGIYILTLFKFIAGPVLGFAAGYSPLEIIFVTVLGMMSSVTVFTFLGSKLKKIYQSKFGKAKKTFSKKSRQIVSLWSKYGELGIAFLTPILLTPVGGTLILVSFGTRKRKIFSYMLISALIWAILFSFSIDWILSISFISDLIT